MLAESVIEPTSLLKILNPLGTSKYHYIPQIACEKIEVFTSFPINFISTVFETNRMTIRRLKLPGLTEILLAIVHFPSKLHMKDASQAMESIELANNIRMIEQQVGHTRTVLVGDLNMNPFEDGVVSASGLHGVMSKNIALRGSRVVQSKPYPFFYNPMWHLLGRESDEPPGTYYLHKSEQIVYFWNTFDQVLIRPDLLQFFNIEDLRIVKSDGKNSFLNDDGIPNNNISDHLPILFKLEL
jgi:hypothetical protein